ncbi:hypothetical protein [Mycobacterium botniense]|uniref:Uncharacterized protein n=1 Tax=Mycobacterium botniense TaxID=84962 RepID=A0A7I9Y1Y6_9MYCO|nr:hypothetical protein [Mycobacterium botniense]GFG75893.1 hypothetical protein MBOT_32580 [Mycobacterium botniense]
MAVDLAWSAEEQQPEPEQLVPELELAEPGPPRHWPVVQVFGLVCGGLVALAVASVATMTGRFGIRNILSV